jgi:signal transduction histidine kinase
VRAIDRAILLCAQTLEYARGQEHAIDTAPFDFAALVDEAIQALAPATPAAKLVNEVPRPFTIAAGRSECERMVTNLLRNAAQAGATIITVRAQRNAGADGDRKSPGRPDAVAIEVIDNGPGLAADARAHLFEPFASARKGGTGLGLAIVRDLVEAHGGTVRLLDCGTGAHFRIELPRA